MKKILTRKIRANSLPIFPVATHPVSHKTYEGGLQRIEEPEDELGQQDDFLISAADFLDASNTISETNNSVVENENFDEDSVLVTLEEFIRTAHISSTTDEPDNFLNIDHIKLLSSPKNPYGKYNVFLKRNRNTSSSDFLLYGNSYAQLDSEEDLYNEDGDYLMTVKEFIQTLEKRDDSRDILSLVEFLRNY